MAAGPKLALAPIIHEKTEVQKASDAKPLTLMDRIILRLTEIFEHNERLGTTRQ